MEVPIRMLVLSKPVSSRPVVMVCDGRSLSFYFSVVISFLVRPCFCGLWLTPGCFNGLCVSMAVAKPDVFISLLFFFRVHVLSTPTLGCTPTSVQQCKCVHEPQLLQ